MSTVAIVVACLLAGAQKFDVPADVLLGILAVEGGGIGVESRPNRNGTQDLGLWQINTHWLDDFAKAWGVSPEEARRRIRDDGCVNAVTAAYVFRYKLNYAKGDVMRAIALYNPGDPTYRDKVLAAMERQRRGELGRAPARR